jgi:signal transduction histidine kinase
VNCQENLYPLCQNKPILAKITIVSIFANSNEKHESEIARQAMEACEHIISEMGAELHDDLIQRLSILRLSLDKLERSLSNRAETETILITMRSEFQEVIQSVRKISRRLLPVVHDSNSFQEGIEMLCQNMERPGTGNIHFETMGTEQKLSPLAETYLSRIIQELIHNAYKHSSAWHVWVRLMWHPEKVLVEVEDDGTGFSKISEFIDLLRKKNGTLKMRSHVLGATIHYSEGGKGLLAKVEYRIMHDSGNTA